ncbi:MAG: hypothetical protein HC883_02420 [Bdellovibrionaceae bacterium]|nr:hypothetical protein [Pseudobdellovibrionaceae bacterium]
MRARLSRILMSMLISVVLTGILSLSARAEGQYQQPDVFLRYTYKLEQNQISDRGVFSQRVPRFADLERDRFRFNNYEQFLDYLLAQAPSLKKHFVLLHHSQSMQLASPEHPRVVLFDGGMVFTFAEHPDNRDKRVEILEVDPSTYQVEMREIVFRGNDVAFNAKPKACASCHGQPAKPLWDPYDFWPNAYGSSVGAVSTRQEGEAFKQLRAAASSSAILSRLHLMPAVTRGAEENTAFTQYIHQINLGRFFKTELPGKNLTAVRYPLLAALNGCFSTFPREPFATQKEQLLSYFPAGLTRKHRAPGPDLQ